MSPLIYLRAILGPKLYKMYQSGSIPGQAYVANIAENLGDSVIKWIRIGWTFCYWTSPLLMLFLYRRGAFSPEGLTVLASYVAGVGVILVVAVLVRAFGRVLNPEYTTFLHILTTAQKSWTPENKKRLAQYDFDFSAWPVDFDSNTVSEGDGSKRRPVAPVASSPRHRSLLERINMLPCQLLSYLAVHTFGRRMLYPGATSLIQALMAPALLQGRSKLIEENGGIRTKVRTRDHNDIDTMFVDRRNNPGGQNGNRLVICSEGNSGFYEVGCMCTPLDGGYSVLGWNHPGFSGSSGAPFPSQEQNAISAVMDYAINRLGFQPENIVLFAWSIGGYNAAWAAMSFPDVGHVVLDATFDDIMPLAVTKLPTSWRSIIEYAIRQHLNLNNADCLCKYPGPVLLIRRSKDEMITTVDPTVLSSNRGNDLAIKLLKHRYPSVVDDSTMPYVREWLSTDQSGQATLRSRYGVDEEVFRSVYKTNPEWTERTYPSSLGEGLPRDKKIQLALYLVSKYLEDYDSTHCTPLPAIYFHEPWNETKTTATTSAML